MRLLNSKKEGFVLLYALLVSSIVLIIGLTLSNIILKQLIISSISREMNQAYYAANTGRECAQFLRQLQASFKDSTEPGIRALKYGCGGGLEDGDMGSDLIDSEVGLNYKRPSYGVTGEVDSCFVIETTIDDQNNPKEFQEVDIRGYNASCSSVSGIWTPDTRGRTVERVLCIDFAGGSSTCTGSD